MRCYTCKRNRQPELFKSKQSKRCVECAEATDKLCPDCSQRKPLDEFKPKSSSKLYAYCKPCRRVRSKNYDRARRSKESEKLKRLEASRARDNSAASKRWRRENADKLKAKRAEYAANAGIKTLAGRQNQRAKRLGAPGTVRTMDLEFISEESGEVCACAAEHTISENNPITVDHVKSLRNGGSNCVHNIQLLCRRCNMKKGTSHFDFRTEDFTRKLYERYPVCGVVGGGGFCRTAFESRNGILIGRPGWSEDKECL